MMTMAEQKIVPNVFSSLIEFARGIFELGELRKLAFTDPLTGAFNRHYLKRYGHKDYKYLYFVDINNLSAINKQQSHRAGDQHIVFCANLLRAGLDRESVIIRYGGDEFLVLTNQQTIPTSDYYSIGRGELPDFALAFETADRCMRMSKVALHNA